MEPLQPSIRSSAAAAVAAVIDIVQSENLVDRARDSGNYFMQGLQAIAERHGAITNVRGQGLMIGFDFSLADGKNPGTASNAFMYGCRRRGVHLTYGYGGTSFRIIPPLTITRSEIDFAIQVIEQALQEVLGGSSGKASLPENPYTRRLVEGQPLRRLFNHWWRSSPEQWLEKGRKEIRKLGAKAQ